MDHTPSSIAALLQRLFCHRADDYAIQQPDGQYLRARRPLTPETLSDHVEGRVTVGVYQVRGATVRWICLDPDSDSGDPERIRPAVSILAGTLRHFGLRPVVERSGGKGWHLWLFCEELPARLARTVGLGLIQEAGEEAQLGVKKIEVFPKQSNVNESAPFGNLVKLPLGRRADNGRPGEICNPLTLEPLPYAQQVVLLESASFHTAAELQELVDENGWDEPPATASPHAPSANGRAVPGFRGAGGGQELPCFSRILSEGTQQGNRDNIAYSLAKLCRRQGMPESAALSTLTLWDGQKVTPPLGDRIILQKVRSAYKGGKSVGCENVQAASLCPALEGALCPIYGQDTFTEAPPELAGQEFPSIEPLVKIQTEPPKYRVTVSGQTLEISLTQLAKFAEFKLVCISQLQMVPILPEVKIEGKRLPPQTVWEIHVLKPALESIADYESAPPDAGKSGAMWDNICQFLRESRPSLELQDAHAGKLVKTEEHFIFKGALLRGWLQRNNLLTMDPHEIWSVARAHGATDGNLKRGGRQTWVWRVPIEAVEGKA